MKIKWDVVFIPVVIAISVGIVIPFLIFGVIFDYNILLFQFEYAHLVGEMDALDYDIVSRLQTEGLMPAIVGGRAYVRGCLGSFGLGVLTTIGCVAIWLGLKKVKQK